MYHRVTDLVKKVRVMDDKANELLRLQEYIARPKLIVVDDEAGLAARLNYLIEDIQAMARDIANDTGERNE